MTVVTINNRRWFASLSWKRRADDPAPAGEAIIVGENMAELPSAVDGTPSEIRVLAEVLLAGLAGPDWFAVLRTDDDRYAIVSAAAGLITRDEIVADLDLVVASINESAVSRDTVHAPADVHLDGVVPLDLDEIANAPAIPVTHIKIRKSRTRHYIGSAAIVLGIMVLVAVWYQFGREEPEPEQTVAVQQPPTVTVTLDGASLIDACRNVLFLRQLQVPGWRLVRTRCVAELSDPGIVEIHPGFAQRASIIVNWSLEAGHDAPLQRRLLEEQLKHWPLASIVENKAWAAAPLAPVLVEWNGLTTDLVQLREELDRRAGPWVSSLSYMKSSDGQWRVTMKGAGLLDRLFRSLHGIEGLEVTRLDRGGSSVWTVTGRLQEPKLLLETDFQERIHPMRALTDIAQSDPNTHGDT